MPSDKMWGEIVGGLTLAAVMPLAFVTGGIYVLNGRTFREGGRAVWVPVDEFATKFGEKHGQLIEKTLVKAAVWTVVGGIGDGIADELSEDHPPKGPGA